MKQQTTQKPRTGVREYQRIRRYMSKIYLYGFFKRRHFGDMNGGSAKNFNFVMSLIRELMDTDLKRDSKVIHKMYHRDSSRALTDSYMFHALDVHTDMVEYLHMLSALRTCDKTFEQIDKHISMSLADPPSVGTIRNRIKTLVSYGCVKKTADGRYALADDGLDLLTDEQLLQLYRYVCFCAGSTYPRVAGSFLRRTLERYFYARKLAVPTQQEILLRHNSSHNIFDEELVYQLMTYMEQPCWVFFDDRRRLPVALRVDVRLGRQFLRELRMGQVVQRTDGEYYEVWTRDPIELKPLLRSYAPYLQILPGDHTLGEAIRTDLEQMLAALDKGVSA